MTQLAKAQELAGREAAYAAGAPEAMKPLPLRKVVLVTAGTEGVGAAIARKLKRDNYIVAVTYRNEKQAVAWQDAMEKEGYLFFAYPCDLKSFAASQRLINDVVHDLGSVDILVNAAGRSFGRGQERDSAFSVTCAAMDGMIERGFGRIINVSFLGGAKAEAVRESGLHKLTQELSAEVVKNGITVNTVSPGSILEPVSAGAYRNPEGVADIVSFLAAEESGNVNGVDIPADGQSTKEGLYDERNL